MIFNANYDNSLWLIMNSDKNNREKIVEFVKSLPNELYQLIHARLDEYLEYQKGNINILDSSDNFCLSGSVFSKDGYGCKYSFIIDMIDNSLTINKFLLKDKRYQKIFGLTLNAETTYNNVDNFRKQKVGCVWDNGIDFKYVMISTIIGKMVVYSDDILFKKYKKVNVNEIPEDISINDLSDREGPVRIRKIY